MKGLKKLAVVVAAVALAASGLFVVAGATASGGFQVGTVKSVTLSADSDYINEVTAKDVDVINALKDLLGAATSSAKKPSDAESVATIRVEGDQTVSFELLRSGSDYVLRSGNQYRKTTYNAFNNLVNTIGTGKVYRYSSYPVGTVSIGSETRTLGGSAGIVSGTYQYRRLSGKYNTVKVPVENEVHLLTTTTGKLYLPSVNAQVDSALFAVKQNGKTIWEGTSAEAGKYTLPEPGGYDIYYTAKSNGTYYQYDITYHYYLEYTDNTAVAFTIDGDDTHLGEVVVLRVTGGDSSLPVATYTTNIQFAIPPKFFRQADGSQIMLFPVSYLNAAGQHWVEVSFAGEKARFTINAKDKQWQRQDLAVSESTAQETILSQQANAEYEQVIGPLRSVMDDKQYWSGKFILPVSDHKVTTQFGMVRYTNGQPTSVRHGALDLAVPKGTPVKATGAGRVLYAGYLKLTGNTVLIEHGFGLKSWYYHMDSLGVATGNMVEQGAIIGTVGSTGFSTGPHLHFGMSVNNIFINPYTAINTELLAK